MFFFSGATALIYQVVWTRMLTLTFGSTTLAVSTVLSVFMGGLAAGSAIAGRKADVSASPLRLYGLLELCIGLFAIMTPWIFLLLEKAYILIYRTVSPDFTVSTIIRFALSSVMLLPPAMLMGGTFPVLSRYFFCEEPEKRGRTISVLYFINTTGAVFGTVLSGFFLIQTMGIRVLLFTAGLVNIGIYLYATWLIRPHEKVKVISYPFERNHGEIMDSRFRSDALLALLIIFISGLAALIYEVVWTRVLTMVIGSSTYSFTTMLATFLTGIALGSAIIGRLADVRERAITLLAVCQLATGVAAVMTATLFGLLPDMFVSIFSMSGGSFFLFTLSNFLLCFVIMLPATIFMGASFPLAGAVVINAAGVSGKKTGLLYAWNTTGAIIGAFVSGFILLPAIGIHHTLMATILLNLLSASVLYIYYLSQKKSPLNTLVTVFSLVLLITLTFIWQPPWNRLKMTSGPYAYAREYTKMPIDERIANLEQLFYREGPIATVSVVKERGHIRLAVDGKTDAGNFRDMTTQVLLGHIPMMLNPSAKDVLVIGFASGITAGAVSMHDVSSIDCVEIEPAMKEASNFFRKENFNIMADERFRLIVDDGRSFLLTSGKKYDVIISEPSNPWQSGSSRLFTRETFLNARKALRDGGIMVQWMHLYGTSVDSLRLVARTFLSVFPHTLMWMDPSYPDVIFTGSSRKIVVNPEQIRKIYSSRPGVRKSLGRIGYADDWSLMRTFVLDEDQVRSFAETGQINTDNLPVLEFQAPKSLYHENAIRDNLKALAAYRSAEPFPSVSAGADDVGQISFVLKEWGTALARKGSAMYARGAFAKAAALDPTDHISYVSLGFLRMATNDISGALTAYENASRLDPGNPSTHANLGILHYRSGEIEKAYKHLGTAIELGEQSPNTRNNYAVVLASKGLFSEALQEIEKVLKDDPGNKTALTNLTLFRNIMSARD